MPGRGDSKGRVHSFNGFRESIDAIMHRRNEDIAGDAVIDDKLAVEIDYDIPGVDPLKEDDLKTINDEAIVIDVLF